MNFSLRLKDIHYAGYTSRIMGKLFEDTPLQALEPLIYGYENCFLFGRDVNSIKVIVNETARIPFIIPLGENALFEDCCVQDLDFI